MTTSTPKRRNAMSGQEVGAVASEQEGFGPKDSRYVDVGALEWQDSGIPGIQKKTLYEDKESGHSTVLFKMSPGAVVPLHEHTDVEQTFMLEGSLHDKQGVITPGNYAMRPPGSVHVAHAPDGALFLAIFMKPNRFFREGEEPEGSVH
jgi:anti-sigma factor ChrR (cupin superfamily)